MNYLLWGIVVAAAVVSFPMEAQRKRKHPETLPYRWGIFIGMQLAVAGSIAGLGVPVALFSDGDEGLVPVYLLVAVIYIGAGLFVLLRHRWAWVVGTVLTLNPIWWIANYRYGRNRWGEFKALQPLPSYWSVGTAQPQPDNGSILASEIRALDALRNDGLITDDEFQSKKTQLLDLREVRDTGTLKQ